MKLYGDYHSEPWEKDYASSPGKALRYCTENVLSLMALPFAQLRLISILEQSDVHGSRCFKIVRENYLSTE